MVVVIHGFMKLSNIALIKNLQLDITSYVIQAFPGSLIDFERIHITEMNDLTFI